MKKIQIYKLLNAHYGLVIIVGFLDNDGFIQIVDSHNFSGYYKFSSFSDMLVIAEDYLEFKLDVLVGRINLFRKKKKVNQFLVEGILKLHSKNISFVEGYIGRRPSSKAYVWLQASCFDEKAFFELKMSNMEVFKKKFKVIEGSLHYQDDVYRFNSFCKVLKFKNNNQQIILRLANKRFVLTVKATYETLVTCDLLKMTVNGVIDVRLQDYFGRILYQGESNLASIEKKGFIIL